MRFKRGTLQTASYCSSNSLQTLVGKCRMVLDSLERPRYCLNPRGTRAVPVVSLVDACAVCAKNAHEKKLFPACVRAGLLYLWDLILDPLYPHKGQNEHYLGCRS